MEEKLTYDEIMEKIKQVDSFLEDEQSRKILEIRRKRSYEKKYGMLPELMKYASHRCQEYNDSYCFRHSQAIVEMKKIEGKTVVFYGAGNMGKRHSANARRLKPFLENNKLMFCDKNHENLKTFQNLPVISPENLAENYKDAFVIITSFLYQDEICQFLIEHHFTPKQIFVPFRFDDYDQQYFDESIIQFTEKEVFVDAGVLNGNTSILFSKKCEGNYEKIYLFEPQKHYFYLTDEILRKENITEFTLYQKGLWDKKEILYFGCINGGFGEGKGDANVEVPVDSLDNILGDTRVTFIKMDVEGAELKALEGARNIISKYKPKLTISLYHKREDIYKIPLLIKELVPEYRFYIRHYCNHWQETVLYAVI